MALYDIGDTVRLTFFVSVNNVLTDADAVAITVTKPDGTTVSPSPTIDHSAVGTYVVVVGIDMAGQWLWRWVATGPGGVPLTAEDGAFDVAEQLRATLYATVSELREELGDTVTQNLSVTLLEKAVLATSRAIDEWCGRRFWLDATPTSREFSPAPGTTTMPVPDIGSKTGLVMKTGRNGNGTYAETVDPQSYLLAPLDADANGGAYSWTRIITSGWEFPYPRITGWPTIQVTARWGWSQIPAPVNEACIIKAVSLFKRKEAPWGIAGFSDYGPVRITQRDGDVIDLLADFERVGFGA